MPYDFSMLDGAQEEPQGQVKPEQPRYDFSMLDNPDGRISSGERITEAAVTDALPDSLSFAGFDTGIQIPESVAAGLVTAGHMMTDSYRGVKQMFGVDEAQMKEEERWIDALYSHSKYSVSTKVGGVVGAVAEPVGLLIPAAKIGKVAKGASYLAKAKSIGKGLAVSGTIGAAYGSTLYVDEGETRMGHTLMGGALGAGFHAAMRGGKAVIDGRKLRKASELYSGIETRWAENILNDITPDEMIKLEKSMDSKLVKKLGEATDILGRAPALATNKKEANAVLNYWKGTAKQTDFPIGGVDSAVGIMSTRVNNISPAVAHRMREYERVVLQDTHNKLMTAKPFLQSYKKMHKDIQRQVSKALFNGDHSEAEFLMMQHGRPGMLGEYQAVRQVLDDMGDQLMSMGRITDKVESYFPRIIKDKDRLMKILGTKEKALVEEALSRAEAKVAQRGYGLSPLEQSEVINKVIRGFGPRSLTEIKPGFARGRKIREIGDELLDHYADPAEALDSYLRTATTDIEKFKFFGRDIKFKKEGNLMFLDPDKSVGEIVRRVMKEENLNSSQVKELSELLKIRFSVGERSTSWLMQDMKNYMYTALLGNPLSAATQLGDVGVAVYINGFIPGLKGLAKSLVRNKSRVTMEGFGLADNLVEEFASTRTSAKVLNTMLKYSGFRSMDKLGKETLLNSSLARWQGMWKKNGMPHPKKMAAFEAKYKQAFGDEYWELVSDLKNKRMTDRVKSMLFSELSDVQPITKSEMPEQYLKMPNGRVVYMLKTFMLKQLDILRKDAYQEIRKGNVMKGTTNLMRYGIIVGSTNAGAQYVKDWMLGREVQPEFSDIGTHLLKTFGWSEYTNKMISDGNVSKAVWDMTLPPFAMFDKILKADPKAIQFMPIVGRLYYNFFMGGLEEWNEKQTQKLFQEQMPDLEWDELE